MRLLLLVHGVAAVVLAVVVLALGQAARGRGGGPLVPVTVVAGIGAAPVVSLVVSGIGYLLLSTPWRRRRSCPGRCWWSG